MNPARKTDLSPRERAWQQVRDCHALMRTETMAQWFGDDPHRFVDFSIQAAGVLLDYSKNRLTREARSRLFELARASDLGNAIEQLFTGEPVNNTEQRPALHTALRGDGSALPGGQRDEVRQTFERMKQLVEELHAGTWRGASGLPITDVVNIGIGGSDLGPVMATLALTPYHQEKVRVHFVSNIDSRHITQKLHDLNPETTLFIISSKSFTTLETLKNAETARDWCRLAGIPEQQLRQHFIAVSSNVKAAVSFGVSADNVFPMWDWVGGRYSLWSAIGLPIAIAVGYERFQELHAGAREMDEHFRQAPFEENMPVLLGLLAVWYIDFFKTQAQVVIPYDHYLHKFPSFLQQLEMESSGKTVTREGLPVTHETMGAIFGEAGSNTQHSFHQLLHQGSFMIPVDFIVEASGQQSVGDQHRYLLANCLAQSRALMMGKQYDEVVAELKSQGMDESGIKRLAPHKVIPGNKPSNTLLLEQLTPGTLGALIALYEHKVYVQSVVWGINPFDQWGVELGKQMSGDIAPMLLDGAGTDEMDASTCGQIDFITRHSLK